MKAREQVRNSTRHLFLLFYFYFLGVLHLEFVEFLCFYFARCFSIRTGRARAQSARAEAGLRLCFALKSLCFSKLIRRWKDEMCQAL
jgi:hypothetical protein